MGLRRCSLCGRRGLLGGIHCFDNVLTSYLGRLKKYHTEHQALSLDDPLIDNRPLDHIRSLLNVVQIGQIRLRKIEPDLIAQ